MFNCSYVVLFTEVHFRCSILFIRFSWVKMWPILNLFIMVWCLRGSDTSCTHGRVVDFISLSLLFLLFFILINIFGLGLYLLGLLKWVVIFHQLAIITVPTLNVIIIMTKNIYLVWIIIIYFDLCLKWYIFVRYSILD